MATKSISQLDTQSTANETDLFEVAIVDANSASGYASKKESAAAIADAIVGEYQYPLRITGTTAKTIAGAINELKNLVDLLPQFAIEVVQALPVSDISTTTIYLVPAQDPEQGNYYEEYIYVNNAWELVGTTAVDLSQYYTSAQVDTLLAAKADSASLATVATSGAYADLSGKPTIDTALDDTSTNAVENRAVASEINSIKSDITVDGSASGDIASFVDGSDNPLKELKISIVAQQSGTGDPSPTNVRPISGFSAVNVGDINDTEKVQYFKGLLDGTWDFINLGTLDWSYANNTFYTPENFLPTYGNYTRNNCSYYNTVYVSTSAEMPNKSIRIYANRIYVKDSAYTDTTAFKTAMNGVYLIYELATPTTPTITLAQFNTLVSAFGLQGWLVQITMPSEAGTVYGGYINPLTGVLTVTHANIASYDGETINEPWISSMDVYVAGATPTTGAQVVYPLTTPVTYQLTPVEVRSLLGLNNVWADCGSVTELKYTRDLNLCINDIIARIEALEGANNTRSLSVSPTLTKSIVSDSDTAEGKTEETEEETKEEAQNER